MRLSIAALFQVFLTSVAISLVAERGFAQTSFRGGDRILCGSPSPGNCERGQSSYDRSTIDAFQNVGFHALTHSPLWNAQPFGASVIRVQKSADQCAALAPTGAQNIQESFKGQIEGKLGGIVGSLTGGIATLAGEFKTISEDTLKNYPESHKLYVWQRLIYLACIDGNSRIDINALAQAYLVGPSSFASGSAVEEAALEIELIGFDNAATEDLIAHHEVARPLEKIRIPNLVFSLKNSSSDTVSAFLDECEFVRFQLPQKLNLTFLDTQSRSPGYRSISINSLVGVARFKVPGHAVLRPGQKRMFSYGIYAIEALSFEGRQQNHSSCSFTYSSNKNAFAQRKQITFISPKGVVSGR